MKAKVLGRMAVIGLCSVLAVGCAGETEPAADRGEASEGSETSGTPTESGSGETPKQEGAVTLTVWSEAAGNELLEELIQSFKEEYAGQAEFDIRIEEASDADTREMYWGMYIMRRMCFLWRTTKWQVWWQAGHWHKCPMRRR